MRFAVHVVYYANRKRELLRRSLLPLATEIAELPGVERCFIDRQWRFGPHARLCVRAATPGVEAAVTELALPRIRAYLEAHPSRQLIDPAAYAQVSQRLGTVELVPPPYEPLWADNTVFVAPYGPREDLLGPAAAVDFYETLQARAIAPIRALLDACADDDTQRLDYVLQLLVMLAATWPSGVFAGHLSYRSHLEEFLFDADRSGAIRQLFAQRFAAMASDLVTRVRELLDELVEISSRSQDPLPFAHLRRHQKVYAGDDPILGQWSELFAQGWSAALPLADSGALTEEPGLRHLEVATTLNEQAKAKWTFDEGRQWSPFHAAMRQLSDAEQYSQFVEFSCYRWLVNAFYALLPLLDVAPRDRYFLQYLGIHAIEAIFGKTWQQHIALVQRDRQAAP